MNGFHDENDNLEPGGQFVWVVEDRRKEDHYPEDRGDEGLHVAKSGDGNSEPEPYEQTVHGDHSRDRHSDEDLRTQWHQSRQRKTR